MPNLAEGTILGGDFKIVAPLSSGGMGEVYVAQQLSTGGRRALKVMRAELLEAPRFRERFEQEARIGGRIESENVVHVISAGVDAPTGMPYMVMELLDGEDLRDYVATRGGLPPLDVAGLFEQICDALASAHAIGVVHRDIKPENIFVCRSRRANAGVVVKILDFGVAKVIAETGARGTAAVGTPTWMAPEQGETNSSRIGPHTDVWALGLVAFHVLTGKVFWLAANAERTDVNGILREVIIDPIPKASERARALGASRELPKEFDAWFARCVAREPADRFESVALLEAELLAALGADPARVSEKRARAMPAPGAKRRARALRADVSTQAFLEGRAGPSSTEPAVSSTMPVVAEARDMERPPDTLPPPTMRELPVVSARPLIPLPPSALRDIHGVDSKKKRESAVPWLVLLALLGLGLLGAIWGLR